MKKIVELIKKYEREILFSVFLLGLVGIFLTFLVDFGLGESGYNFVGKTKKITLSPGRPITQTFTAHAPGLHQLRVVLGKSDIRWNESIEFQLMDEACTEAIATTIFTREPRQQGAYTVFSFPPQLASEGRRYCFAATYHAAEDRKGEKPYLSAIDEPEEVFADRTLTDSNKNKIYPSQTLFLRPAYTTGSLRDDIRQLEDRLSQSKPAFVKGSMLAFGISGFLLATLFFIWIIRRKE